MHALEGVTVVDFGQYLAGPFGPMILADLGANVIKVEPLTGDGMRNVSSPFCGCQRGKRAISIDLKNPRGKELALELVAKADLVHHNMTKGVADRLGIGYDDCTRVKPDIVYCNTYAYGREGPQSHFGGLDPLYQAVCGLEYEAGPVEGGNPPLYLRFGMTDTANAMLSVVASLVALYHQRTTGEGQALWTSLLDGAAMLSSDAQLVDGVAVERPKLDADQTGIDACYRLYRTQDGWLQIAAVTDAQFAALCTALGQAELCEDTRFANAASRREHRQQLEALFAPVFASRTTIVWSGVLDDAGVPNEIPIDTLGGKTQFFDADNERLGLVASYEHPKLGPMRQFGSFIDFSDTPGEIRGPAPQAGEHTREILGWLGYDDAQIQALRDDGVVYWPDENYSWAV